MRDDNRGYPYLGAIVMGIVVGMLTFAAFWFLSTIPNPKPTVQWVQFELPDDKSYISWMPCVRTSGWLLPVVTCYPTESRSVGLGEDPEFDPHMRRG